jgi:hypothetical protein
MNTYSTLAQIPTRSAIASTETLFVSLINNNADKIKSLAAFKSMTKVQMVNLKTKYLPVYQSDVNREQKIQIQKVTRKNISK